MKIAVTYENENIYQHFGHTQQFKIYEITNGKIIKSEIVLTNGSGHGALASFLASHDVDALICGGIGAGAKSALSSACIALYGGVRGNCDEAIQHLLEGTLNYNSEISCSHHDEEHSCGSHSCSSHSCHNS